MSSKETVPVVKEEAKKDEVEPKKETKESEDKENKETPKKEEKKENEEPKTRPESATQENGEATGNSQLPTLREQFKAFSKFGDTKSDGRLLTLSQSDKWMKQAKVIDKTITTTDTAIHFKKFKQNKISYQDYEKFLEDLAKAKKQEVTPIKDKLRGCGAPGTTRTTNVVKNEAIDRLTNTKKYTGSHKLRFDSEGRGRGAVGRKEDTSKDGYVQGYKNKDTYTKSH